MGQITLTPPSFESVDDQAEWNANGLAPLIKEFQRTIQRRLPGSKTVIALGAQRRGSPDLHANIFVNSNVSDDDLATALERARTVTAAGFRFGPIRETNIYEINETTLTLSAHYLAKNAATPVRHRDGDQDHYDDLSRVLYRQGVPGRHVRHLGHSGARMRFPRGKNGWGSKLGDRAAERREWVERQKSPLVLCISISDQVDLTESDSQHKLAPVINQNLCDSTGVIRDDREAIYSEG